MTASNRDNDFKQLLGAAEEIARLGGESTLEMFRTSVEAEYKEDETPVTEADRRAEELIRREIRKRFPGHGIIGEEYGSDGEDRDIVWVVDPIDGTRSFVHGIPLYTTLVAVLVEGESEVGVICAPALDEMVSAATGLGCHWNGRPCRVRSCNDLAKATFLTTDIENVWEYGHKGAFEALLSRTRLHRTWGDAYGHMMVATGRADLMFDPVLSIWDAAALKPVVMEAGGLYTDTRGKSSVNSEEALSCVPGIHQEVIELFNQNRS